MQRKAGTAKNRKSAVPADKEEEKDAEKIYLL
jgi:hypothetical protein